MTTAKYLAILDRSTYIPALALEIRPEGQGEQCVAARAGFWGSSPHGRFVVLVDLNGMSCQSDPYKWGGTRTLKEAHLWILDHWDEIASPSVVDVEFILGEAPKPKEPPWPLPIA